MKGRCALKKHKKQGVYNPGSDRVKEWIYYFQIVIQSNFQ